MNRGCADHYLTQCNAISQTLNPASDSLALNFGNFTWLHTDRRIPAAHETAVDANFPLHAIMMHEWHAGTAGTLKVQLSDTAANSSKDEQLATAEVKLDMRQWKDSQTYQAQIPLSTAQV